MKKDVVIIGAGAAGLMCALSAADRKRTVQIIEHTGTIANKVRISGGGRCNFTNLSLSSSNYVSANPHFCKSALARFTPHDFISLLEKHGVGYEEKKDGRLFCSGGSGEIIRLLRKECSDAGVGIYTQCRVISIQKNSFFITKTSNGILESKSVVIATGGLSYPEIGATDSGYRIARQFGLKVTPLRPALVPLTYNRRDQLSLGGLSGVSFDSIVRCGNAAFRGNTLLTHRGLSGPGVLQASLFWDKGMALSINLLPGVDTDELFMMKRRSQSKLSNLLSCLLPGRFAKIWCALYTIDTPIIQYSEKELRAIAQRLHHWQIIPEGTEGFSKAEVTRGGVNTEELSSKTMEANKIPGLYFAGEVIDVTGQLGGYNLHWAWASGYTAGCYA